MLARRVPFEGDSAMAVIYQHIHEPPPPIEELPPQIQTVIDRALAKNPDERYQSAKQMAADFYEAIGVHAEAATIPPTHQTQTPEPATPSKKQTPIWIGAAIFACVCVGALVLGIVGASAFDLFPAREVPLATPISTTEMQPAPTEQASDGPIPETSSSLVGVLRFQSGIATMDQITVNAALAPLPENTHYEVWMIDDVNEQSQSLGILEQNTGDQFSLTYVEPQGQNLIALYNRMEITLEPSPDDSPNSSRDVQYSASLPPESLAHIRHLLSGFQATPGQIPITVGLVDNVTLIKDAAEAMLEAYNTGDRISVRSNAETIVNLIVGNENLEFYND
jgi:serine/threonine protein kinase